VLPKAGVELAPKAGVLCPNTALPPNAGADAPNAGVDVDAPKAGVDAAPNAGVADAPKAEVDDAPNAGVDAPNSGVVVLPNAGVNTGRFEPNGLVAAGAPNGLGLVAPKAEHTQTFKRTCQKP
jgi:hypothetical protein